MKKIFLFSTFILSLTLVGCSSKNNEETKGTTASNSTMQKEQATEVRSSPVKEDAAKDEALIELEEYSTIQSQVSLSDLTGTVSLNNLKKRIIIFKDHNQREKYKTIFIKAKKMLKIIDLSDHNTMIFIGNI